MVEREAVSENQDSRVTSDEREGLGKGIKWHRKDKAWELRRHQQM